ncbi:hypothetical protein [Hansschlegelia plantiphila]|uniref:Lipoprotein n=1 Tax=Hansschlegelia plantiphila TaxID=374655 RepID=A0A9W6MWV7_9HYPH|nr:hypothetical protein [Hansschlegelia plantiphila]GLK69265.1 hypothetical protein GCM10008179_29030 [Hansschlegelia plantiphila]
MTVRKPARAAALILLASLTAACSSSPEVKRIGAVPNTDGRWVYDGRRPPSCNDRNRRVRHFHGDGHTTGHEHLGHGHKWNDRNFKGYLTKPPCYIRRAAYLRGEAMAIPAIQTRPSAVGVTATAPNALSGDLS